MLSLSRPRLVTTWQQVPAGVNGAVSSLGLAASAGEQRSKVTWWPLGHVGTSAGAPLMSQPVAASPLAWPARDGPWVVNGMQQVLQIFTLEYSGRNWKWLMTVFNCLA
jgi:hypothetical protein